jgi:shikimate kinase
MGAGKSSVGRALASLLHWSFVDLDHEIELRQQQRIRDLFQSQGEAGFRDIEKTTLEEIIGQLSSATVIALGGGTFVQKPNVGLLRACGAQVVFLEAPVELMMQRCQVGTQLPNDNHRPLASDPDAFQALYDLRLPHYRGADLTVIANNLTFDEQAQEIASRLNLVPVER